MAMPVTLVAGASAVATIGLVATGPMIAAVLVAGVATAAFHPESARSVRSAAGARGSTGLGIYTLGGNLGTAIGPVVATALVSALGWFGPCLLVAPAAVMAWWVHGADRCKARVPRESAAPAGARGHLAAAQRSAFVRCVIILVLRAGLSTCVTAFAPLYLVRVRGWQPGRAGLMLTIALLAGVVAGVLAGPLADRVGRRRVLLATLAPLGPLLVGFTLLPDAAAIACLVLIGTCTMAPYVIVMATAQDYLPGREGLAAGVAMGLGTALGSLAVLVVGHLADAAGLATALVTAAVLPAIATVLAAVSRARR
jgi:FSR family fosmidomycin resistance protein-like MFS transporter